MPLDTDALARIIAQLVKEEVGRLTRDDDDIRAENDALRKQVAGLEDKLRATNDLVDQIRADVTHKFYDDEKLKQTIETSWDQDLSNRVAAMLPDDWQPALERVKQDLTDRIEATKLMPGPAGPAGPAGETGPQGPQGEPGQAGQDAPAPTELQVIDGLKAIWPEVRTLAVKHLPQIEHRGTYAEGTEYYAGDEVIWKDSTFRAIRNTTDKPGTDDWQCIAKSKSGRRGEAGAVGPQGPAGERGKDGVGLADMVLEDGQLVQTRTDGEAVIIDMKEMLTKAIQDFVTPEALTGGET